MNPDTRAYRKDLLPKQQVITDSNGNQAGDRPLSGCGEARFSTDPKTTNLNTVVSVPFQDSVLEDVIGAEDSLA